MASGGCPFQCKSTALVVREPPGDVVPIIVPGACPKAGLPAGKGDITRIAPADDHPCIGQKRGDQAEMIDVVRHLVDNACGRRCGERVQPVEVAAGRDFGCVGSQQANCFERVGPRYADQFMEMLEIV